MITIGWGMVVILTNNFIMNKLVNGMRYLTPEEVLREYKFEPKTKEEALDFLYRAGIVTKKGNYRKIYRTANIKTQNG